MHFGLQSRGLRLPQKFVSGVIDNLRDMCVSEEVGKAISALCCIFDISSTTPFREKLTTLTDFLQNLLGFMGMLDMQVVMQVLLHLRM